MKLKKLVLIGLIGIVASTIAFGQCVVNGPWMPCATSFSDSYSLPCDPSGDFEPNYTSTVSAGNDVPCTGDGPYGKSSGYSVIVTDACAQSYSVWDCDEDGNPHEYTGTYYSDNGGSLPDPDSYDCPD